MRLKVSTFLIAILLFIIPSSAAIMPQPKVELDQYEMEVSSVDNIYIKGSVSLARGQWITLHTSTDSLPINFIITPDSNRAEDFKIKVPKMFLKEGTNVFHVMSKSLRNKVSASNFKTITIKVNTGTNSSKKNQTINASNKTLVVGQTANLGAKASSGLKLTYDTNNQNVTVDSAGKMIARKVGITKVKIKQAGNSTYNSVSKTITITIKPTTSSIAKKAQKIMASNKTIKVGKSASLGAKSSSKLKLTYKSSNPKVASVNSKGVVTGKKAGKAVITIKQAGNSKFKAAAKKVTVVVNKNTQKIIAKGKTINVGKSISLGAKATSKLKLTYKSSNPKIASVNSKGVVTGKKAGKVVITIKQKGNYKFKQTSRKVAIVVKDTGKYTIVYHGGSNIGQSDVTGKMSKQVVSKGKVVKLKKCMYKKKDYEFVGWSLENGRANTHNKKHIEDFDNINMTHFQLGTVAKVRKPSAVGNGKTWKQLKNSQKQQLVDKASVKNLAGNKKTIHLYAVWKGKGPVAAVDWACIIAKDNNFNYGKSYHKWHGFSDRREHCHGCYFCKTNRKNWNGKYRYKEAKKWDLSHNYLSAQSEDQKFDKTYCCNPFICAAYTHGANHKTGKCMMNNMDYRSWKNSSNSHGKFRRCSISDRKPGDIYAHGETHVWMWVGNGKIVEANGYYGWSAKSIRVKKGHSISPSRAFRYYPY